MIALATFIGGIALIIAAFSFHPIVGILAALVILS